MRALLSTATGGPETIRVQTVAEPEPGRGEVRIQVEAVGVISAVAQRLPGLTLMNIYGSTEATSPMMLTPPGMIGAHGDSVGAAAPGADLIVMDEAGRALPPGKVGEI